MSVTLKKNFPRLRAHFMHPPFLDPPLLESIYCHCKGIRVSAHVQIQLSSPSQNDPERPLDEDEQLLDEISKDQERCELWMKKLARSGKGTLPLVGREGSTGLHSSVISVLATPNDVPSWLSIFPTTGLLARAHRCRHAARTFYLLGSTGCMWERDGLAGSQTGRGRVL